MAWKASFATGKLFNGDRQKVFNWHDLVHHAGFQSAFGRHGFACEDDIQRLGQTDQTRQASCAAPRGQEADQGFGKANLCGFIVGSDAVITGQANFVTTADGGAMNGGDRWNPQTRKPIHDLLPEFDQFLDIVGTFFTHALEVGPGNEDGRLGADENEAFEVRR